mgnify:CR=1 FL=1
MEVSDQQICSLKHQFSLSTFQSGPMFLVKISCWVSTLKPLSSLAHLKSVGCSFCISAASDFLWEGWLVHINYDQCKVWLMLVDKHHSYTRSSLINFACIGVAPPLTVHATDISRGAATPIHAKWIKLDQRLYSIILFKHRLYHNCFLLFILRNRTDNNILAL